MRAIHLKGFGEVRNIISRIRICLTEEIIGMILVKDMLVLISVSKWLIGSILIHQ